MKLNKSVKAIGENALRASKFEAWNTKTVITKAVQTFQCEDCYSAWKHRSRPETRTNLSEAASQSSRNSARFREVDASQKSSLVIDSSRELFQYRYLAKPHWLSMCQSRQVGFPEQYLARDEDKLLSWMAEFSEFSYLFQLLQLPLDHFEIDDLLLKQPFGCILNFKFLKQKKQLWLKKWRSATAFWC